MFQNPMCRRLLSGVVLLLGGFQGAAHAAADELADALTCLLYNSDAADDPLRVGLAVLSVILRPHTPTI